MSIFKSFFIEKYDKYGGDPRGLVLINWENFEKKINTINDQSFIKESITNWAWYFVSITKSYEFDSNESDSYLIKNENIVFADIPEIEIHKRALHFVKDYESALSTQNSQEISFLPQLVIVKNYGYDFWKGNHPYVDSLGPYLHLIKDNPGILKKYGKIECPFLSKPVEEGLKVEYSNQWPAFILKKGKILFCRTLFYGLELNENVPTLYF